VFSGVGPETKADIWRMAIGSPGEQPQPFLQSAFNEHHARLSPDVRWVAYASDESGRDEVYVRPFPSGDGQWQISSAGGTDPRWRGDGKELFFIEADGNMMAASVSADTDGARLEFRPASPRQLFDTRVRALSPTVPFWSYDVTPDGTRFLVASPVDSSPTLNVVVNWTTALKN
jgi:hypothetical protein